MKKIIFLMAFTVLSFIQIMYGQDCNNVTVEAFPMIPQSGLNSYFGVRVSLTQPYYQNVTVSGYIWDGPDEHGFNTDHPYTLTIVAGSLSAETSVNFYQTGPAAEGAANITSVSPCPEFILTEDQSYAVLLSTEFQNFVQKRNEFLDKISTAVNMGTSLNSIRDAALAAIQNNNYQQFYTIVFGSSQAGESFFTSYTTARDAMLQANPIIEQHPEVFVCQTCNTTLEYETNYFFDNFQTFNVNRFTPGAELIDQTIARTDTRKPEFVSYAEQEVNYSFNNFQTSNTNSFALVSEQIEQDVINTVKKIVCGSYWNQVKLTFCAAGCGATTLGLAAGLCGWGCWCTFCTKNSVVANVICAD